MNRLYVIVVSSKNLRGFLIIFIFVVSFIYIGSTFLFEGFSKYSGEYPKVEIPKMVPLVIDKKTFFKILPENGCTNETNVLIGIFSKPNESSIRKFIRDNWGQDKYLGSKKKLIFVIAEDKDANTNNKLIEENQNFHDILQLDFYDHYYNLSIKTFGLLSYASEYCSHINCLLKADSDTTVNLIGVDQLCNYFDLTHEHESLILGQIRPNAQKSLIKSNTNHIFANITSTKCVSGSLYLLYGKSIFNKLVTSLGSTPFFDFGDYRHLPENLIFTGILREYTKIDIRDMGGFGCCGQISFWCNKVFNSSQISIGFENGRLTKEHAWDLMQNAIDGYYHDQCNVSQQKNYITANYNTTAGMSNMIWRFASLYGMGKTLGREPYLDGRNHAQMEKMGELQELFPKMIEKLYVLHPDESEVKMVEFGLDCCKYEDVAILSNITAQYVKVYANFLQSYKFFHIYQDEIRALLQCGPVTMNVVDSKAKQIFGDDKAHFLCAHVRRGDFISNIMLESTKEFTEPAIEFAFNYLRQHGHNNISLVLLGTDREFIKSLRVNHTLFTKIYTPEPQSRGEDFCLAVNYCDSLIMTASGSTFEWWISYLLPKNSPIFYNSQISDYGNFTKDIHDYDIFPKEWIMLTLKNGTVYRETKWWYQRNNWTLEMADKYILKNTYF